MFKRIIKFMLVLAVAVIAGLIFTDKTAYASTYYDSYLPKDTDNDDELADKVVKFNNIDWYIIKDNATALNAGTVTLLAKDPIGVSIFNEFYGSSKYSESVVKSYLDGLTTGSGSFAGVADAIEKISSLEIYHGDEIYDTATDVKLYLLSKAEAQNLPENIRKCSWSVVEASPYWWLRSPRDDDLKSISVCDGIDSDVTVSATVSNKLSVRPALKLNLSSVIFSPGTKSFILCNVTITPGSNMTKTPDSGEATQTGLGSAMTPVVYTADEGYYFPDEIKNRPVHRDGAGGPLS